MSFLALRKPLQIIIFLPCFFLLQLAQAQSVNMTTSVQTVKPKPQTSDLSPRLEFLVQSLNYSSESDIDRKSQGQAEFRLGFRKTGFFFADAQIIVGTFSSSHSTYGTMPEAYVAMGGNEKNYLAIGIKKQKLNFLDEYYHFGLYQSFLTTDFISYHDQGFAGLQAQVRAEFLGVRIGWQPYFFPNQTPQVREENGSLVSGNRWAKRPPTRFEFVGGQSNKIEYNIRDYEKKDVVSHQGYTLSLIAGPDNERPWVQASYAHKPLNEIPLTRETYAGIADFTGHVNLSPVVTYSDVRSLDINLDRGVLQTTLSYIEDQPMNNNAAADETLQSLQPIQIYGACISTKIETSGHRRLEVTLAAAHVQGGEIKDVTANGQESLFTFAAERTQFRDPITLGISTDVAFINSQPLLAKVRWTYDRKFKGSLISAEVNYETKSYVRLRAGFDLLGLESQPDPDAPSNFLSEHQANDRLFAGVGYVY
ncbi:MAG: hypothetical protein H7061_09890 [Bdellovibrionaceae bacterium]|nr:hypothetical protein [Bdellovibrio sp.]